MKTTTTTCDICGAGKIYDANFKEGVAITVIFVTEQTEGHPAEPYLHLKTIDTCCDCYANILEGNAVFAKGAQGYNTYYFKKNDVINDEFLK